MAALLLRASELPCGPAGAEPPVPSPVKAALPEKLTRVLARLGEGMLFRVSSLALAIRSAMFKPSGG